MKSNKKLLSNRVVVDIKRHTPIRSIWFHKKIPTDWLTIKTGDFLIKKYSFKPFTCCKGFIIAFLVCTAALPKYEIRL